LRLPGTLVEGDRAEIVAAVRNEKVMDGSIDVVLTTNIGGHSVEQAKRVDVTSTGVIEVPFHVSLDCSTESADVSGWDLLSATNAVFRLTVSAGDVTDVFERSVPLTPRGITTVVSSGGVSDSDATAWIEAPPSAPVAASRMRIIVGPSVSGSLLDIVSSPTNLHERDAIPVASTTDTLSGNLMAMLGIQLAHKFTPDSDDPRARSLDVSIRSTIGQLVTAQNTDGGWGWSVGNPVSDRYASARAVWSLSLSRRAGYRVPDSGHQQSIQYLTSQITVTEADDNESKAVLLHALCMAGKPNFSLGNRLHRERLSLSTPALLYLCLALAEMDRTEMAGELLSLIDRAPSERAGGLARTPAAPHACHQSPLHDLALHAVALQHVAPETPQAQELIDRLWAERTGSRWSPDQATGPAAWALCRWVERNPFEADRYQLTVSVNDRQLQVWELDATESSRVVDVPAHLLVEGKQRVHFEIEGRGRFTYQVALSGSLAEEELRSTTDSWRVSRTYTPAPLERDGREIPRGFANVRGVTDPFVNPLNELPVDRRGLVELSVTRDVPDAVPNESLEYLVITEPIPAGAFVLPMSVRGSFERVAFAPGSITFHVGNRRQVEPIHYELCGYLAGEYHVPRTVVRDAYRPDRMAVADPARLKVVPAGTPSADPYRLSPQELYELGARSFQQRDWPAAESLLTELFSEWSLQGQPYRDTVRMLLDIALERNTSDQVMRYFEIIFEQWPDDEIPLAKALRIGSAYHALGEHERAYLVFRAAVEGIFAREGGVAGMLASHGESLRSVEVMRELVRDYPPEPYVAKAHYALAQRVYALAPEVENDPRMRKAGVTREGLITAAWRMLEDFLTEYPLDPAADQAAFAAANALLEAKHYAEAAEAGQRYGRRYPQSDLLNHFRFIVGFSRFALGQHDLAASVLREVAASEPGRKTSGDVTIADNKWSAIYILGQIHHSLGEVAEAIRMYRMVEDRYPDAKQSIQQFLREMIRLPEVTTVRPECPVELELAYRNIAACDLKIYRIDLMKFAQLRHGLAGIRDINLAGIEPQHEMTVELGDGRDYRIRTRRLVLDLTEQGAYLLVCRGGGQFASGLVVITPLGIEMHHEPVAGEVRAIVKDLNTDQLVYQAQVQVFSAEGADIVTGETDRRGLFVANGIFRRAIVIAQAGPGTYAFHRDAVTARIAAAEAGRATPLFSRAAAPPTMSSDRRPERREVGVVLAGPGADPEEQRIETILDTLVSVTFQDTPLEEVARAITREHNITVRVNHRALEDVGLSANEPVSVDVRNLTLRSAMRLILEPLDLTYVLRHESLTITTPEDAESQLTAVLYPVTDLARYRDPEGTVWSDYDTLIGTITSTVMPDSWEDVGGAGYVDGMRYQDTDVLIVAQRQDAHEHIASLLETLRAVTRTETADGELPIKERSVAADSRAPRGGIGGGMGGFGAAAAGDRLRVGLPGRPLPPAAGAGLLQGLEETKRRLQGTQQDELQRIYEQGKGGMGGGIGAGGMF
jgi:alpha-2-macroglobulin